MENFAFKSASSVNMEIIQNSKEEQQTRSHQFPTFEEYVSRVKNHSKGCPCCPNVPKNLELKSEIQNSPEFERSHQQVRI
jgi:hypothetical protein